MMVLINELSGDSKIWIYQSSRELTDEENTLANRMLQEFVSSWSAHNIPLAAAGEIRFNRFFILAVDENKAGASGCSIDSSVRFMRSIEQQFKIRLFDRMSFAYHNGESIAVLDKDAFSREIENGNIRNDTIVFNNLVRTRDELELNWKLPMAQSWHAHFFAKS